MKISGSYYRRITVKCSKEIRTLRVLVARYSEKNLLNIAEKVTCKLYPIHTDNWGTWKSCLEAWSSATAMEGGSLLQKRGSRNCATGLVCNNLENFQQHLGQVCHLSAKFLYALIFCQSSKHRVARTDITCCSKEVLRKNFDLRDRHTPKATAASYACTKFLKFCLRSSQMGDTCHVCWSSMNLHQYIWKLLKLLSCY